MRGIMFHQCHRSHHDRWRQFKKGFKLPFLSGNESISGLTDSEFLLHPVYYPVAQTVST